MAIRPAITHPPDDEPFGVLVSRLGDDVRRIVRAEVALVQVRVEASVGAVRAATGGLLAAALFVLGAFGALVAALVMLVATLVPLTTWIAASIVGGALLLLGAIVAAVAIAVLKRGLRAALQPADVEVIPGGR